jgi:MFS family permease
MNKNLLLLLAGRMVSDTGTSIKMVVMPLFILDAGGSAATIGLFSFFALMPALIVYPFAGVLGDRQNRKTIMILTDFLSGALMLGLAALSHGGLLTLAVLFVGQAATSALNGLFDPASKGILPRLVAAESLPRANSAVASLRTMSGMLGPVLGVLLYVNFGITVLFVVNGIAFVLSAFSEILIEYTHEKQEEIGKFSSDLQDGIRFIAGQKTIGVLCLFLMTLYMLLMPLFSVVLPLFFRTVLDFPDVQYGWLQTIFIAGMFVGSIATGVLFGKAGREKTAMALGLLLMALAALGFSALTFPAALTLLGTDTALYFWTLAGVLGLLSIAMMFIAVPAQTSIQKRTPGHYMSRVFSIVSMITRGGLPLGALAYGLLLDRIEIFLAVFASSILMILAAIVFWFLMTRRELE